MREACLTTVLDLSLPLDDDAGVVARLSAGLCSCLELLRVHPRLKLELALAGGVTSALLRFGHERALQLVAERASAGQISFLSTASHGGFLPLLPPGESFRQLELTHQQNNGALGDFVYRPEGLFPPQLGYSRRIAELAKRRGMRRIVLDDLAYHGGSVQLPRERHFNLRGEQRLALFFIDRRLSEAVAGGHGASAEAIRAAIPSRKPGYVVVRVPARALHSGGPAEQLLTSVAHADHLLPALLEDLLAFFGDLEEVEPFACALGTDPGELASGVPYPRWSAPGNELQAILWRLAQLASAEAARATLARGDDAQALGRLRLCLDEALDCSAWRYAAGRPERDPERVVEGGRRLLEALRAGRPAVSTAALSEGEELFAHLEQRCRAEGQLGHSCLSEDGVFAPH